MLKIFMLPETSLLLYLIYFVDNQKLLSVRFKLLVDPLLDGHMSTFCSRGMSFMREYMFRLEALQPAHMHMEVFSSL